MIDVKLLNEAFENLVGEDAVHLTCEELARSRRFMNAVDYAYKKAVREGLDPSHIATCYEIGMEYARLMQRQVA